MLRSRISLLTLSPLLLLLGGPQSIQGGQQLSELTFASFEDFDECFRDAGIDVRTAKGFVTLRPDDYVIHTRGNKLAGTTAQTGSGRKLRFSPDFMGKKVFELAEVEAKGAELFVFGGSGKASLNGVPIQFGDFRHHGGWTRAEIDESLLRRGKNEIIFHAGFRLAQDRETAPPKFSFVSTDGGQSWQAAEGGEFLIHLRVHRHPAEGTLTSPVIDFANSEGKSIICSRMLVKRASVRWNAFEPKGTSVGLLARSGATPLVERNWSDWRPPRETPPARYIQWRAVLRTKDRTKTPVLSRVTVAAEVDLLAEPEELGLQVRKFQNQKIVRGSFAYGFQRPSPKLSKLRSEYRLDEIVAPGKTEFEKLILLRNWARRQWPFNDGFGGTWDALAILSAPPGKKGMCVHFATVFAQCALALGFNARQVVIDHHFVADVWSNQYGKWVLMDVEGVYPPTGFKKYGTAHYLDARSKRPLSCLEIHRAYHRALDQGTETIEGLIQKYYFDTDEGQFVPHEMVRAPKVLRPYEHFAYPPRNDYLDQLDPWEEYHGQDHYHSNDYLWWRGESPRGTSPLYSRESDRAGDFDWTVNQAHLTLTATGRPDELSVTVDTFTPNLEAIHYRCGKEDWRSIDCEGSGPDSYCASFSWELKPGANVLAVKPVNRFAREGITSSVVVVRNQE